METFGKLLIFVQYTTVFGRLLIRSYYQDRNALKIGALSRGSGCFQQIARFGHPQLVRVPAPDHSPFRQAANKLKEYQRSP